MVLVSGRAFELLFFTIPVLVVLLNSIIAVWLSTAAQKHRGVEWFVAMLCAGVVWGVIAFLQAVFPSIGAITELQYVSIFATGTGFWCFAVFISKHTGLDFHRHPVAVAASVLAVPGLAVALATNPSHHLVLSELTHLTEPVSYVAWEPGPAFLLPILPLALYVTYGELALVRTLLSTERRNGLQLLLVLVGMLSVGVMRLVGQAGVFPASGFAYSTWGLLPFVACFTVALFWADFLDVQPVARSAVVENLRDPVVVLDTERRVIEFNDASERLWPDIADQTGIAFAEAFPSLAADLDLSDTGPDATQRITTLVAGQTRYFSVNVSRVTRGRDDDRALFSLLLRDVTELKQSRWQLRKQNEQLDKIGSTISHDLRNPINVADGYAEILQEMADEEIPDPDAAERARKYAGEIRSTHDRMVDIISDVLTIAREGKTVEETEQVALDAVAHEAWRNVDTAGATLAVVDSRPIQADRSKLLTIFENLFRNAVEHGSTSPPSQARADAVEPAATEPASGDGVPTDDGVTVQPSGDDREAEPLTVTVGATDDGFSIEDDGTGIPQEHVADLFEYGYTTAEDGTGLGLSIVETMVDSHGWTVTLDASTPGAHFVFDTVGTETLTDSTISAGELN